LNGNLTAVKLRSKTFGNSFFFYHKFNFKKYLEEFFIVKFTQKKNSILIQSQKPKKRRKKIQKIQAMALELRAFVKF